MLFTQPKFSHFLPTSFLPTRYKKAIDNKSFWKIIIPLFTKRPLKGEKIDLIENGKNISNDTELVNIFNGYYFRT